MLAFVGGWTWPGALLLAPLLGGLTMVGTLARAQPPMAPRGEPSPRTIRVEGTGEVRVAPDEAFIDLAVETLAPTAQAAAEENARRMERVLAALVRAGIPRPEMRTRDYVVYPEYTPSIRPEQPPEPRGYRVSNRVEVHVRELARLGALLDTALGAGANRVESVRFGLSQPQAAEGEALRQAVARARQSAQVLASALEVRLGPVREASTVSEPPRFIPMGGAHLEMAADVPTTPLQPQEQTVRATVTLIYAIDGAPAPGKDR
jgi:uncharacterized protein